VGFRFSAELKYDLRLSFDLVADMIKAIDGRQFFHPPDSKD